MGSAAVDGRARGKPYFNKGFFRTKAGLQIEDPDGGLLELRASGTSGRRPSTARPSYISMQRLRQEAREQYGCILQDEL